MSTAPYITPVEELFRRLGHPPLTFAEWAAKAPDVFESAEEVAEFQEYNTGLRS